MKCETGPVTRRFGGSDWSVLSCSDGKTMIVASAPGNPAGPFLFVLAARGDGSYVVAGEGNGDKAASDAALADLNALTPDDLASLLNATRAIRK